MSAIERERLSKPSARRLRRPGKKRRRTCQRPKKKLQRKQEKSAGRRDRPRIRLREKSAGERDKSVRERQGRMHEQVEKDEADCSREAFNDLPLLALSDGGPFVRSG